MAESADALDSGSSGSNTVGVQVPSSASKKGLSIIHIGSPFLISDRYEVIHIIVLNNIQFGDIMKS